LTNRLLRFSTILSILTLALAACNLPVATDCARPEIFCVGLVTAFGKVDDHGLNQSAWEAVQQALDEGLIHKSDFIETIDARDRAKNIRTFLENDYDLIVTVGVSMDEDTRLAADDWPDRLFIGVDQPAEESRPNLAALTFPEDQGGFLAGALAAFVTRTGKVAALCELEEIPSMWRACEGFRAGVRLVNPELKPRIVYRLDNRPSDLLFNDTAWGRDQALFVLRSGVDVLYAAGGESGRAALETATEKEILVIGADEDMYYQVDHTDFVLTSVVKLAAPKVHELIRLAVEGKFPGGEVKGEYAYSPFRELERLVPSSVREALESLRRSLADGSLPTGVAPEP
jgi:basic membrane protein A